VARVALITTGKAEFLGLAAALTRLFKDHVFEPVPTKGPLNGFTSSRVKPVAAEDGSKLRLLIQEASACLTTKAHGYDFVVVLDDLELENYDQPDVGIATVRQAAAAHVDKLTERNQRIANETVEALQWRASFHLAVPMLEAWFYGDPAALERAGASARPAQLLADCDPEAFATADSAYAADDGSLCTAWSALPDDKRDSKHNQPEWLKTGAPRDRHPKRYLKWLAFDPASDNCTSYDEAKGGSEALRNLDWKRLLETPNHFTWLRSMLVDIADMLGATLPDELAGNCAALTNRWAPRPDPRLRNI